MAVPTLLSVSPTSGPTGGSILVTLTGTNFRLPDTPAPIGPVTPPANPSVRVLFGTAEATDVRVLSSSLLRVTLPPSAFDPTSATPGAVAVTVTNLASTGLPIPGESASLAGAFTYARPVLETAPSTETLLARVVRAFLLLMRRQLLDNIKMTVHTDYAEQGAEVALFASLPGIAVVGPAMQENRFYSENETRVVALGGGAYAEERVPYTVDLVFTVIGADDNTNRLLNLMQQTTLFFHRNKTISIPRDPALPSGDMLTYEVEIEEGGDFDMEAGQAANNASLRSFTGSVVIRGVGLFETDMQQAITYEIQDVFAGVNEPNAILLGGLISDGSGLPLEQDGSAPPAAGIGYIALDSGGIEQKD